jgi:hypothetical protein
VRRSNGLLPLVTRILRFNFINLKTYIMMDGMNNGMNNGWGIWLWLDYQPCCSMGLLFG